MFPRALSTFLHLAILYGLMGLAAGLAMATVQYILTRHRW